MTIPFLAGVLPVLVLIAATLVLVPATWQMRSAQIWKRRRREEMRALLDAFEAWRREQWSL